jgi:hypothetical protein
VSTKCGADQSFSTDADIEPPMFNAYKIQIASWLYKYKDKSVIDFDLLTGKSAEAFANTLFPYMYLYVAPLTAQDLLDILSNHSEKNTDLMLAALAKSTLKQAYAIIHKLDEASRRLIVEFILRCRKTSSFRWRM